ncbi:uncharacterized protein MONOS_733 [Monocercomonoides exilis]|uniref:uncharacterized protein n=1 Tax=Monocercomonoides exilis TaxID=2049356 RepID=UPI00355A6CFD|nr:hypothetical protein MONOS_733 [Monocercomonoides exilis]|eukprot:MONOS_733.1-p1 / transcript=MONOS_733.1 / gene=MONOS_733 / organism=Monocercomonoides_exilis_PA203 / gene_product=unspecified product / transcript_product=unspecified product / location=Mono_scaffold00012:153090-153435(-) / protein_length=102 / sequence_SO=supercontig / SO=protein_coding / is_pseudo=false
MTLKRQGPNLCRLKDIPRGSGFRAGGPHHCTHALNSSAALERVRKGVLDHTYRDKRGLETHYRGANLLLAETGLLRDNKNADGETIGGVVRGGARSVEGDG